MAFYTVYRGQDLTIEFTGTVAEDITGWTLLFSVSTMPGTSPVFSEACVITDAAAGEFQVQLSAANTESINIGRYYWDIWRTDNGSADPIASGNLAVVNGVNFPA